MPTWSPQQDEALRAVSEWLKDKSGPQVFRLFGWAGTGKSTLAVHLAQGVRSVKYAAFTGKAALVMRKKGCKGASTIHSLIYSLVSEKEGEPKFALDPESDAATADLIVIDEVSMVDESLGRDLLSFGTKVLVLGDPFQLPPVQGAGLLHLGRARHHAHRNSPPGRRQSHHPHVDGNPRGRPSRIRPL